MFSCLKKIEVKKTLRKREINKLIKLAESHVSINGLTSSHKYSIVKKAIQELKEQGIEPTIKLKKMLLLSSKAWLKDCIEFRIGTLTK